MTDWPDLVTMIPEAEYGTAKIEHFEVDGHTSKFAAIRGDYLPMGEYIRLKVNDNIVMSDTRMEKQTNREVVLNANGHVLIVGLGIGLIVVPICNKSKVTKVTVVEDNPDVIKLVEPYISHDKLEVINGDIFKWQPTNGVKYDVIYFDIWQDICIDNLEEINKLHNKFKFKLNRENSECWMSSWRVDHLRYLRNRGC